jgi:nucleotide-binding universal stress UspA family protein
LNIQTTLLGIVSGSSFVLAIAAILFWMFRVPGASTAPVARAYRSLTAIHKVLVPVTEAFPSERVIGLACQLGRAQKAELLLLNVIVVPYTMPLDVALPNEELKAQKALELGAAIAKRYGYEVRRRHIHDRSAADGILHVANEEGVDAIVMGVGLKSRSAMQWGRTSLDIMRRANCEVIVDKVPLEESPFEPAT